MEAFSLPIVGAVVSLLFAGNIYFIKRLVEKVEYGANSSSAAMNEVKNVQTTVNYVSNQLVELKSEIKDLRRVEIEVAVIKDRMGIKKSQVSGG